MGYLNASVVWHDSCSYIAALFGMISNMTVKLWRSWPLQVAPIDMQIANQALYMTLDFTLFGAWSRLVASAFVRFSRKYVLVDVGYLTLVKFNVRRDGTYSHHNYLFAVCLYSGGLHTSNNRTVAYWQLLSTIFAVNCGHVKHMFNTLTRPPMCYNIN